MPLHNVTISKTLKQRSLPLDEAVQEPPLVKFAADRAMGFVLAEVGPQLIFVAVLALWSLQSSQQVRCVRPVPYFRIRWPGKP